MGICETLISQDLYKEAYGMIREFGEEGLRIKRLLKLCTKLISQNLAEADDLLLHMARRIFLSGKGDSVILDYLCRYFNGRESRASWSTRIPSPSISSFSMIPRQARIFSMGWSGNISKHRSSSSRSSNTGSFV